MLPDRVSNPGPLANESGVLPIALRGPASTLIRDVPLTPYFHLTDGNLTKDTYNVLRRL